MSTHPFAKATNHSCVVSVEGKKMMRENKIEYAALQQNDAGCLLEEREVMAAIKARDKDLLVLAKQIESLKEDFEQHIKEGQKQTELIAHHKRVSNALEGQQMENVNIRLWDTPTALEKTFINDTSSDHALKIRKAFQVDNGKRKEGAISVDDVLLDEIYLSGLTLTLDPNRIYLK